MSVGRRKFMKGAAAAGGLALGSGAITGFPIIKANAIKNITLRQFGSDQEATERRQGRADLSCSALSDPITMPFLQGLEKHQ